MKIYTKTGDDGSTGLLGGDRISKTSLRIEAIGEVDELNAAIGLVRAISEDPLFESIQCSLFDLGSELAAPLGGKFSIPGPGEDRSRELEASIDEMSQGLPELKNFILPGGCEEAARLHMARCICRRAERAVLALNENEVVSVESRVFLNRLSDWLFVAARAANARHGIEDVPWRKLEGKSS